ncbi:MAG: hypothetical protein ABSH20_30320, partial [Tepidisphaeraceae bacterium]
MLILRIKQTECALEAGRLDEAYELVRAQDMWAHRRGQELAGRIAQALVSRGREHLAAGRLGQADADSQKAARLAGNTGDVAKLRVAVAAATAAVRQADREQAQALAAARQEIRQGHLSAGQRILANLGETRPAVGLLQDVAQQQATVDALVARTNECLGRDDWEAAVDELAKAPPAAGTDLRVRELSGQVKKKVSQRITEALRSGRLDVAGSLLARLQRLACGSVETEQLQRIVHQCRMAWVHVSAGDLQQAQESARRLAAMLPEAPWLDAAIVSMKQAGEAMEQLRAGPLGFVDSGEPRQRVPRPAFPEAAAAVAIPVCQGPKAESLPARFLLQVDGVGSFLVHRGARVTVGPISSSPACDVGLLTEAQTPVIAIERIEDDYFARSSVPVAVNERPTTGRLLATGDCVALSARSQLVFRLPSPASTSAVLDLKAGRLPRVDVRRVILMDRELVIGPGAAAHVRCDEATEAVVLVIRDGQLVCQARRGLLIDGKPAGMSAAITLGLPVRIGEVGLV